MSDVDSGLTRLVGHGSTGSNKTLDAEYAHKVPSMCPGPGRPHLLSST